MTEIAAASGFAAALARDAVAVDAAIAALLSPTPAAGEIARPARLLEAMRYAALGPGKRLRPFLVMACARACGAPDSPALARVAAALECVHAYSLVHDDLPAMDDDDLRRGRPTLHRAFDEATAILAGDALLTLAFDAMADPAAHPDPLVRAELALGLARAAGAGGMVGGQALDIEAESSPGVPAAERVAELHAMKTGALLRFSAEAGAIFAGAAGARREALAGYGAALGAAFQIADDVLDVEGEASALGKKVGKDAGRGKATFVAALGLDRARDRRDRCVAEAKAHLGRAGLGAGALDALRAAADFAARRRS
ncbi:MAG: polyprenyl synthetase family protein [Hyphomicrobiales bacterium]|nr:polyprenyl synthetase family protein [Hyphomicrobiales bacterium]